MGYTFSGGSDALPDDEEHDVTTPSPTAQARAEREHRKVAVLAVLAKADAPDTPNEIIRMAVANHGIHVRRAHLRGSYGRSGTSLLTSLDKAGLIHWTVRKDRLSGAAWKITSTGLSYLTAHRHLLEEA